MGEHLEKMKNKAGNTALDTANVVIAKPFRLHSARDCKWGAPYTSPTQPNFSETWIRCAGFIRSPVVSKRICYPTGNDIPDSMELTEQPSEVVLTKY
uniref:Uncharacterized protein n=1 Tax=Solanum tuberosum TaxID=4113 RepID=M1BR48_SOLTU